MNYKEFHEEYIHNLVGVLDNEEVESQIEKLVRLIVKTHKGGGTVYLFGNGGHSATATHNSTDLGSLGIKAVSLTANTSELTRIANDFGYEYVFQKQLENCLEEMDLVIGISASGNSQNVIEALKYANQQRATSVAMVGFQEGGLAKKIAKHYIHIKTEDGAYGLAEDAHMTICHLVVFYLKGHGGF